MDKSNKVIEEMRVASEIMARSMSSMHAVTHRESDNDVRNGVRILSMRWGENGQAARVRL